MMPLCTTDTPPETCGWAFFSEGTPCPPGNGRLLRALYGEFSGRRVPGERGSGAGRRALAHTHGGNELGVRADEDVVLDDRAVLVRPVVVAGDRAGADIHVFSDLAVADVAEGVGLGAPADAACLDL